MRWIFALRSPACAGMTKAVEPFAYYLPFGRPMRFVIPYPIGNPNALGFRFKFPACAGMTKAVEPFAYYLPFGRQRRFVIPYLIGNLNALVFALRFPPARE